MFLTKHCNICLKSKKALFSIIEEDAKNVSYFTKLKCTVPEIQWTQNHNICFICVEQLNKSYNFKELCLKSFGIQVSIDNVLPNSLPTENILILNEETGTIFNNDDNKANIQFIEETQDIDDPYEPPDAGDNYSDNDNVEIEDGAKYVVPFSVDNQVSQTIELVTEEDGLDDKIEDSLWAPSPKEDTSLKSTNDSKQYFCDVCNKGFKALSSLKAHSLSRHTDSSKWTNDCYACDKVFSRKSSLVAHVKNKHLEKGSFTCFECEQTFTMKHTLVFHIKDRHTKNSKETKEKFKRSFDCNVCNQVFSVRNHLFDHAQREHGISKNEVKPYKCDICGKRFKVSTYLVSHKLYHEGKRNKICNICGKGFITMKDLKIHETYHSNNFTYVCPDCGQTFKNHKLLYAHKISKHVAPELWKFCCNICGKRFPRVSAYKMHMQRHMGDKRFLCHLCDKKFVSKFQLIRHIESHSNVKRFHCDTCGKDYREKRIYNIHLLDVHGIGETTGEKKLCHICSMSFSCNYKLRRHILKHSKPYGCSLCDKKYPDNYHLKQHLQRKHKIMEVEEKVSTEELKEEVTSISNLSSL